MLRFWGLGAFESHLVSMHLCEIGIIYGFEFGGNMMLIFGLLFLGSISFANPSPVNFKGTCIQAYEQPRQSLDSTYLGDGFVNGDREYLHVFLVLKDNLIFLKASYHSDGEAPSDHDYVIDIDSTNLPISEFQKGVPLFLQVKGLNRLKPLECEVRSAEAKI